jgi:copper transport protein
MAAPRNRVARRRWRAIATAAGVVGALVLAPAAAAHPYLVGATPQGGVVAPQTPTSIKLAFTEALVIKGCSLTLTSGSGQVVHVGGLRSTLSGDAMEASLPHLGEGIYTVNWVAYGNDGHTVEGRFQFGVPSPTGQPPPGAARLLATTTASAESAPTESLVSVAARWLAALAAFLLLGAAALFVRLRGRLDDDALGRARTRWLRLAPYVLGVAVLGTLVEAYERADGPHGLALALLTSATSGVAIVVRLAVLLLGGAVVAVGVRRTRLLAYGATGGLALATLALDGHAVTVHSTPALAAFGMILHLLAGGVWIGALIVLAVCVTPTALAAAARAYAPIAVGAAAVMILTGVIAAVREVSRWYFLRWSAYGHILIVKVGIVAVILALGGVAALRGRRSGRLVQVEAGFGVAAVAVAALLAGTLQGRGQPLPSQRGNLLPGLGVADVALAGASGQLTLAPAQVGLNRLIVANVEPNQTGARAPAAPKSVAVALACGCDGRALSLHATLHPGSAGPSGAWSGEVGLPLDGTYSAELTENGKPTVGSPTFTVGDARTPGSTPLTIASVADLSGPDATECRAQEYGALLSIELMNAAGGVGGTKLHQVVLDDEGNASLARSDALELAARHPVAFLAPCGQGAQNAVAAVGDRIPTIVADDNVPVTQGRYVYRFAPDPYAEGYAAGQYVGKVGLPSIPNAPRRVGALIADNPASRQRLAGLEAALRHYGIAVDAYPGYGAQLEARLQLLLPASRWLGIYADAGFDQLTAAMRAVGARTAQTINPTPIIVSQRLASESFVVQSGPLGVEGQVRVVSDVDPTTNGGSLYAELVSQVVGEQATVPGLSGFVAGQALAYGLVHGDTRAQIAARLRDPGVFSRIATSPWSNRDPADGTLIFRMLLAEFLPDNLIPSGNGAPSEPYEGQFFEDGAWEPASPELFSPLNLPVARGATSSSGTYRAPIQNLPGGGTDGTVPVPKGTRR